jgi:hypothetical protein
MWHKWAATTTTHSLSVLELSYFPGKKKRHILIFVVKIILYVSTRYTILVFMFKFVTGNLDGM